MLNKQRMGSINTECSVWMKISQFLTLLKRKPKKEYESPIIAKTIWENIKSECVKVNIAADNLNGILMLGYGDFGRSIVDQILADGMDQKRVIIKP